MVIKFKLDGVERTIRQNGKNDFVALDPNPNVNKPIGYYSNLGSAVSAHIRNAGSLTPQGKSEVIELKDYVQRHRQLFDQIMGLSVEDIPTAIVTEKSGPQKTITKERQEKMQKGRIAKPDPENNSDDDEDIF